MMRLTAGPFGRLLVRVDCGKLDKAEAQVTLSCASWILPDLFVHFLAFPALEAMLWFEHLLKLEALGVFCTYSRTIIRIT